MRKPIQLITTGKGALVALCNDGAMFRMGAEGWIELEGIPQPPAKQQRKAKPLGEYTTAFEDWWHVYPVKKAKKEAFKAWQKADCESKPAINLIELLHKQLKAGMWADQYTPHPATYLNQERWNDEPMQTDERGEIKKWYDTASGIEAKGAEIGLPYDGKEPFPVYKAKVFAKCGDQAIRNMQV